MSQVSRRRAVLELAVCTLLLAVLSVNALRRMDYLGEHAAHIRMTDASRTAYVAKNIIEGNGYATNDMPAALVDFYDQRGKLHDEHWVNADRFPFAAYATAALYAVTGSTSWEVGILLYNLLAFVAFLALLYRFTSSLWSDRYAGLFAVAVALLHPYTYMFLYWKDGDMLLLTTACMALLVRYYREPPGAISRGLALGLGTLLAWLFLARPNLGIAFLLFFGVGVLHRLWLARREAGTGIGGALRRHTRELLVIGTVIAWCVPFVIHSLSEWGTPLFSANNLYQLPLGTRYGMGTDTWWKYTEPGQLPTFSLLADQAGGELLSKFTSSWAATLKHMVSSYSFELLIGGGVLALLAGRQGPDGERYRQLRPVALVIVFAVVTNLLLLPLYSYQSYSFRHYLAFALPLLWIGAGRGVSLIGEQLRPVVGKIRDHVRSHVPWYVLAGIAVLLVWNFGTKSQVDQPRFFARTGAFLGSHWLGALALLAAVALRRWFLRPPWFPRVVVVVFSLVYACYRPNAPMKRVNFSWFPADEKVWDTMREREGIVSSFALQGEVAWNTGRKNIPAPEWPMHIYSFHFNHGLEIEDLYIESAALMVEEGAFYDAAPGFEGYARLQEQRALPGYEVAFHAQAIRSYPKFRVKPRLKASTVFKLTDRAAVEAMRRSPDRVVVGEPRHVIYAAHGWGSYYVMDGKPVVVATDATRSRYEGLPQQGPFEDASLTFFLEPQRAPRAVELELYAPLPTTLRFFWNLDLYAYDRREDRSAHQIGVHVVQEPGWQKVRLDVPPGLLKAGLNKLGFRTEAFAAGVMCPKAFPDDACMSALLSNGPVSDVKSAPRVVRADDVAEMQFHTAALFAHALQFVY